MPHAAIIPAVSSSAVSALPTMPGPHGKASAGKTADGVFGALFREKAGTMDVAAIVSKVEGKAVPVAAGAKKPLTESGAVAAKQDGADGSAVSIPVIMGDGSAVGSAADASKLNLNSSGAVLPGSVRAQLPTQSPTPAEELAKAIHPHSQILKLTSGIGADATGIPDGGLATAKGASAQSDSKTVSSASVPAERGQHKSKEISKLVPQNTAVAAMPIVIAQPNVIVGASAEAAPAVKAVVTSTGGVSGQVNTAPSVPSSLGTLRTGQTAVASSRSASQKLQGVVATAGNSAPVAASPAGGADGAAIAGHDSANAGTGTKMVSDSATGGLHPGHVAAGHEASNVAAGSAPAAPGAPLEAHFNAHAAGTEAATAMRTAQAAPAAVSQAAGAGAANPSAASPFDRIDQGTSPVVLHAGAQHVEVGVQDPHLGWVEISAQNTSGHVDATLVAASGQTHSELAAQLPAIAQYLQERDVRVGMLAVHHPAAQISGGGGLSGGQAGGGQAGSGQPGGSYPGSNAGSGGGGAQHFRGPDSGSAVSEVRPARVPGASLSGSVSRAAEGSSLRPVSYISVRA